jgi:pimeloyl-ACP methyl ester carboxylesterase
VQLRAARSLFASLTLALVACSDDPVGPTTLDITRTVESGNVALVDGKTPTGALFRLSKPTNWNGRLVVYAHGYVDPKLPIALPAVDDLRRAMNSQGYAVAYSSYSENGFAIEDGIARTHEMKSIFSQELGEPAQTYIIGHSLGGIITQAVAEKYPSDYAGAMPMCGLLGGSKPQLEYIANVRVLFDALFPDVLPGSVLSIPAGTDFATQVAPQLVNLFTTNPQAGLTLGALASFTQAPLPYANSTELVNSAVQALGFHFVGIADLLRRTNGVSPIDNATVTYASSVAPAQVVQLANANAERVTSTTAAQAFVERVYTPTGDLRMPTITLHTSRDPIVPAFHQGLFATKVSAANRQGLLVQSEFNRYGHCTFTGEEMIGGLSDLVLWAEQGIKPTR